MKKLINTIPKGKGKWNLILLVTFFFTLYYANAYAFTLKVQGVNRDGTDNTPVTEFRWTVEEDTTYHVVPGMPDADTISVGFHSSYMPVVASGDNTTPLPGETGGADLDPTKHYYVSVLPQEPRRPPLLRGRCFIYG